MARLPEPFKFNTHELARRAGEMKEYELDIELLEKLGVELISVPAGEIIEVDARLESVTEGILLTADIFAIAKGECTRCLDPVEIEIERKVQELYYYAQKLELPKKKKRNDDEDDLGEGPFEDSKVTGHSGARIGCAIFGRTACKPKYNKTRKNKK